MMFKTSADLLLAKLGRACFCRLYSCVHHGIKLFTRILIKCCVINPVLLDIVGQNSCCGAEALAFYGQFSVAISLYQRACASFS